MAGSPRDAALQLEGILDRGPAGGVVETAPHGRGIAVGERAELVGDSVERSGVIGRVVGAWRPMQAHVRETAPSSGLRRALDNRWISSHTRHAVPGEQLVDLVLEPRWVAR